MTSNIQKPKKGKCEHSSDENNILVNDFKNNVYMQACRCKICGNSWSRSKESPEQRKERIKSSAREHMRNLYWERKGYEEAPPKGYSENRKKKLLPSDELEYQKLIKEGTSETDLKRFRQRALYRLRKSTKPDDPS